MPFAWTITATAREFINRVQKLRKKAGLQITDSIEIFFDSPDASLLTSISANRDMVLSILRVPPLPAQYKPAHAVELGVEDCVINDVTVRVMVTRPSVAFASDALLSLVGGEEVLAKGVEGFLASMDYERVSGNGSKLSLVLNERQVVVQAGTHYFLSAVERVRALALPEFSWV